MAGARPGLWGGQRFYGESKVGYWTLGQVSEQVAKDARTLSYNQGLRLAGKSLGVVGLGIDAVSTGANIYSELKAGNNVGAGLAGAKFGGRLGGAAAGAYVFGALGGAAGTIVPGVGNVAGAAVGAVAGSVVGAIGGEVGMLAGENFVPSVK